MSDDRYADARVLLDGAISEFFTAARRIGLTDDEIACDVIDALAEASDGEIVVYKGDLK